MSDIDLTPDLSRGDTITLGASSLGWDVGVVAYGEVQLSRWSPSAGKRVTKTITYADAARRAHLVSAER